MFYLLVVSLKNKRGIAQTIKVRGADEKLIQFEVHVTP